ncbi:bifunctional metallophosphatase/5'-nucleotidase [Alteromonas sp. BMJM2]|uniref:bifunctional metallophosphatase/5'-nucleotidase n=1 Tax=Alteromonas sp. BMJM2 TaxID=2954241 RepID=UPI0022B53A65|nr:bifunctional metallophosphatase/5'-nucleotidase [Alteromonas sp. BMJM2]
MKKRFICVIAFASLVFLLSCTIKQTQNVPKASITDDLLVKVLGINDFHGQVLANAKGPSGGMYLLANHLLKEIESTQSHTFVLHGGDHVGASPAESALLQDEPSITFLNKLNDYCQQTRKGKCQIMGTAGNHEFDEGSAEMLRLLNGGNHKKGPFLQPNWKGANYTTLSANVIDLESETLILPPYAVHNVNGIDIGFIGLTLDTTPNIVLPGAVDNLRFQDQATIAQKYTKELQSKGIEAIIIVVHDGARADYYAGPTKAESGIPQDSDFMAFLKALPSAVDLVVTGHSHRFTNAYVDNSEGHTMLVTQAFSSGRAYADIELRINKVSKDISYASAQIFKVEKEDLSGLSDAAIATLASIGQTIGGATQFAKRYTERVINTFEASSTQISLGEFIANTHQYALKSDLALMNRGGVRASINEGPLTWGQLFAVQPFSNQLMVRRYSGSQLQSLVNERNYWSSNVKILANGNIILNGEPLQQNAYYTLGGNNFIMGSEEFAVGEFIRLGVEDIEATQNYIELLPTPFSFADKPSH